MAREAWLREEDLEPDDYPEPFMLSLGDSPDRHTHDGVGHAFPCTREELLALRHAIDALLGGSA